MQDICNINIVESINPIINFKKMCAADERKRKYQGVWSKTDCIA